MFEVVSSTIVFNIMSFSLSYVSPPESSVALMKVISQGTEERTQGVSGVNPLSSRSHALLQIQLRSLNQQVAGR